MAIYSCSTTRVLQKGEYRLARNRLRVVNDDKFNSKQLEPYIRQQANSYMLLGWNPFLNIYNWSGKNESKFFNKLLRKLGTAPVVYSKEMMDASVRNIENRLKYKGYYGSKVHTDVKIEGKKVKVDYLVTLGKRYKISKVEYTLPKEGSFSGDYWKDIDNVLIKPGDYLSEELLERECERSAKYMRKNGYYGFTKKNYFFLADTIDNFNLVVLNMNVKNFNAREKLDALQKYYIGDVSISYPRSFKYRSRVLKNMTTIKPGELYDESNINNTYYRLTALKTFSGVNMEMSKRDSNIVDCSINLTPSHLQGFKINLEASSNSTGLFGFSPQFSYFHKNLFRGGEWFNLSFMGNFQMKFNDKTRSNEFGVGANLSFPKFLGLPDKLFRNASFPRTEIKASYNYQDRPEYKRNIISTYYGYSGNIRERLFYQVYPLQMNIVRLFNLDAAFYRTLADNPFMKYSYQDHFDAGAGLNLYFSTNSDVNPKASYISSKFLFDISGNILSLFNPLLKKDRGNSRIIWNIPYSQYVRAELSFGGTKIFDKRNSLAMRLLLGLGYAYGNSSVLPFEKQFYSGGANSLRAWGARSIGPGGMPPDSTFIIPSQTGDVKLEANIEYRFKMFWKLYGAIFVDAGNIWTLHKKADEDKYGSNFRFSAFLNTIALDWGVGLRFDLSVILLRFDWGFRVYDPSRLDKNKTWVMPNQWLNKDNHAFHFGIGYPF